MRNPEAHLRGLADQGRILARTAAASVPPARHRQAAAKAGTSALAHLLDLPQLKSRPAQALGRTWLDNQTAQRIQQLELEYEQWYGRCKILLEQLSLARKNLTTRGNSRELVSALANTRSGKRVETRAKAGAVFLERLAEKDLVYNSEIVDVLRERAAKREEERRNSAEARLLDLSDSSPGLDYVKFPNRAALVNRLSDYPDEAAIMEGAIETFLGEGRDQFRQALASCRVALEGVAIKVTCDRRWKDALTQVADRSTRKLFRTTYELLSAYGAHSGKNPTRAQAEFGIQQTVTCLIWLINHRDEFGKKSG